jgi:glutamate racemase
MIGIFDSGIGGLSVVKEIINHLPGFQIIYFGDTARLPYGTKGADFVKRYSAKITEWLLGRGAEIIIIACHTSSAQAGDFLKKEFKGIPVFDMITPCAKELSSYKSIGIIGTPGTIRSRAWEKHILINNPDSNIQSIACPLFVPLVEEGWIDNNITEQIIKEYLNGFSNIEALILACTHYPFLKKAIKNTLDKNIKIINPAESLAKELKIFLNNNIQIKNKIKKGDNHQFFFSDEPYNFKKISKLCLAQEIKPKITNEII